MIAMCFTNHTSSVYSLALGKVIPKAGPASDAARRNVVVHCMMLVGKFRLEGLMFCLLLRVLSDWWLSCACYIYPRNARHDVTQHLMKPMLVAEGFDACCWSLEISMLAAEGCGHEACES